jgi:hypothetical protein
VIEIRERGVLGLLGYITRVILLILYLSSIIGIFGDKSNIPLNNGLTFTITGWVLLILGFITFFLTFIKDIYQYINDKKR